MCHVIFEMQQLCKQLHEDSQVKKKKKKRSFEKEMFDLRDHFDLLNNGC